MNSADKYHQRPKPDGGPIPTGEIIARFERPGFRGSPDGELRVSVDTMNGRPFVSLRVWERNRDGAWWPGKSGVTVRLKEGDGVAAALVDALLMADDDDAIRRIEAHNAAIDRGQGRHQDPPKARWVEARATDPPARGSDPRPRALPSPSVAEPSREAGKAPWDGRSEFVDVDDQDIPF